ncbi:hypothetical protein QF001_001759 [Paraburkholderia youngii]|uniref:hypothetical protein n=1 Tax=Paraburkholderia youngii TaxID=2782701 RepID=UPI003D22BE8E
MLRVTVELWPGGRESGKRVIATADIARVRDGALADYEVGLKEERFGAVGAIAYVRRYPRWSASVWDLVARCIASALNDGKGRLPPRPVLPEVPVHTSADGRRYVRIQEIPEPAQTFFLAKNESSGRPCISEDPNPRACAWAHDWQDFLDGYR